MGRAGEDVVAPMMAGLPSAPCVPAESYSAKPEHCSTPGVAAMLLCDPREAVTIAYKHPAEVRSVGSFS